MADRSHSFKRRLAVDGLRAVASLMVVLFHCDTPGFRNGYLGTALDSHLSPSCLSTQYTTGVDVFYIISGFVISSSLWNEFAAHQTIDFVRFYARRARRLLPASLVVLLFTAVAAKLTMKPLYVLNQRPLFIAASLYYCNWKFIEEALDYWAPHDRNPIQHYWSLSVEEQFYIVWPLVCWACLWLLRTNTLRFVFLGSCCVASVMWAANAPRDISYMATQGRVYQLLLGTAVAFVLGSSGVQSVGADHADRNFHQQLQSTSHDLRLAGLLSNVSLCALFAMSTSFLLGGSVLPFGMGLFSSLLSLSLIISLELCSNSYASLVLCSRIMQQLGKYSYGIYLWHWPVIVIGDYADVLPITDNWLLRLAVVLTLTIGLAAASWHLLEQSVNAYVSISTRKQQLTVAVGGFISCLVSALVLWMILQVPADVEKLQWDIQHDDQTILPPVFHHNRTTTPSPTVSEGVSDASPVPTAYVNGQPTKPADERCYRKLVPDTCEERQLSGDLPGSVNTTSDKPIMLSIGDSFCQMYLYAMRAIAKWHGWQFGYHCHGGCSYVCVEHRLDEQRCCRTSRRGLKFMADIKPYVLVLSTGALIHPTIKIGDRELELMGVEWKSEFEKGLHAFLSDAVQYAKHVIVFEPVLWLEGVREQCNETGGGCFRMGYDNDVNLFIRSSMRRVCNETGAKSVNPSYILCPNSKCPKEPAPNIVGFLPDEHISKPYGLMLAPQIDELMFGDIPNI